MHPILPLLKMPNNRPRHPVDDANPDYTYTKDRLAPAMPSGLPKNRRNGQTLGPAGKESQDGNTGGATSQPQGEQPKVSLHTTAMQS